MNSIGVGGFFNALNFGQMYSFHVILLPVTVAALVAMHISMAPFDLIRELTLVTAVALVGLIAFSAIFSSPDEKPLTLQSVAQADVAVAVMVALLTLVFVFVPYIPGLNQIPELVGVHRLIWREQYRAVRRAAKTPATSVAATP
jgi:quinol-cytochrome oxidoreductase complex cytochrome b subunit